MRWHLWNGTESQELTRFAPSATFLIDYLRFFDQYARSMTPWSPDSRAFVYAGGGEDGRTGIWVHPVIDDLAPVRISETCVIVSVTHQIISDHWISCRAAFFL